MKYKSIILDSIRLGSIIFLVHNVMIKYPMNNFTASNLFRLPLFLQDYYMKATFYYVNVSWKVKLVILKNQIWMTRGSRV